MVGIAPPSEEDFSPNVVVWGLLSVRVGGPSSLESDVAAADEAAAVDAAADLSPDVAVGRPLLFSVLPPSVGRPLSCAATWRRKGEVAARMTAGAKGRHDLKYRIFDSDRPVEAKKLLESFKYSCNIDMMVMCEVIMGVECPKRLPLSERASNAAKGSLQSDPSQPNLEAASEVAI